MKMKTYHSRSKFLRQRINKFLIIIFDSFFAKSFLEHRPIKNKTR